MRLSNKSDFGKGLVLAIRNALALIALNVALLAMLTGCGAAAATPTSSSASGSGDQMNAQRVTITARDNNFDPKSYSVEADKPIKLTVVNAGQNVHKVEVEDLLPETELGPGQSKTVDIGPQKVGAHRVYCELHEDSGMVAEFVIK